MHMQSNPWPWEQILTPTLKSCVIPISFKPRIYDVKKVNKSEDTLKNICWIQSLLFNDNPMVCDFISQNAQHSTH